MAKIGLFTFGGGYAMIGILESEFVAKRKWLENDEFMNLVTIAESTPGPIVINCATYIGYKKEKFLGSIAASIGVCLPTFTIIYVISLFFDRFLAISWVASAFRGIQVCVIYLILSAGFKMFKKMKKSAFNITVMSITFVAMVLFSLFSISFSSILYILIFGFVGFSVFFIKYMKEQKQLGGKEK